MNRLTNLIAEHGVARWAVNFCSIMVLAVLAIAIDARAADRAAKAADQQYQTRLDFCEEVEHIRGYVRRASERGLSTLPTLTYYKENPNELPAALDALEEDLAAMNPPLDCPMFASELTEGENK